MPEKEKNLEDYLSMYGKRAKLVGLSDEKLLEYLHKLANRKEKDYDGRRVHQVFMNLMESPPRKPPRPLSGFQRAIKELGYKGEEARSLTAFCSIMHLAEGEDGLEEANILATFFKERANWTKEDYKRVMAKYYREAPEEDGSNSETND